ncbi:hypothetical protein K435DRAFT_815128 [Dendrothele bispora CBS 962.96]|uniref:DNA-directed RNA polymerase III subunit RPC3 n=1 Tax=Dendrothele bispora (strain CBS 962.96) TaxID=1314807 RepID=A0A4S8MWV7_DENBC|nr:hypothetical protein K435DRAFT_815128 [Dendrothele bispora CBS 962.96]
MSDELCTKIILQHFGPLTATVANALLTRGRLTFPQLLRYTQLKPRTLRSCLLVLIQHNVLWHTTHPDDGAEVVEFNVDECLVRLRFGTFVCLAESILGNPAGEIVQIILDHGKLTPPQIFHHLGVTPSNAKIKLRYTQALHQLVSSRYLKPSTVLSHISPKDKLIQYESEEKAKISGFPTARQLREAKETARGRLKQEEKEAEKIGLKKKPQPQAKTSKRKTMSDMSQDDTVVDDTVYFRVNPEKFAIHLRNELIEKAARERFNEGAALVVRAILKLTENNQFDVSEVKTDPISISNITLHLSSPSDEEKLSSGLIFSSSSSKKISNSTCIKEYIGMLSSADNPTSQGSAAKFLSTTRASSGRGGGGGKIQVEFDVIIRRLRRRVLESVAREKYGTEGLRIVRLLLDEGKMDEKQIAKSTLMPPQSIRPLLTSLSSDSLVSTYPVPKTSDRNPTRTFYLWYVDLATAYSTILDKMYKTLFNIYARREEERESGANGMVKKVLEKREREDVREAEERRETWLRENAWLGEAAMKGAEEGLLSEWEREVLSEWARKEEKLTVLETRVQEGVFILKDLGRVFGTGTGSLEEE